MNAAGGIAHAQSLPVQDCGEFPPEGARVTRTPRGWQLEHVQVVPRELSEVYPFFERPENLERITPPWLAFRILTPSPVPMHVDARIDYRVVLFGIPVRWRTRIARHEPGVAFTDEQESGPFALWHHVHEFREHSRGTWMLDRVDFRPRFGPLGTIAQHLFVGRLVRRIFAYRRRRIAEIFASGGGA